MSYLIVEDEVTLTKEALGISQKLFVPEEVSNLFAQRAAAMEAVEAEWNDSISRSVIIQSFKHLKQAMGQELPDLNMFAILL